MCPCYFYYTTQKRVCQAVCLTYFVIYAIMKCHRSPTLYEEGGEGLMEIITAFLVSVAAGIVTYYICKWLDRRGK